MSLFKDVLNRLAVKHTDISISWSLYCINKDMYVVIISLLLRDGLLFSELCGEEDNFSAEKRREEQEGHYSSLFSFLRCFLVLE